MALAVHGVAEVACEGGGGGARVALEVGVVVSRERAYDVVAQAGGDGVEADAGGHDERVLASEVEVSGEGAGGVHEGGASGQVEGDDAQGLGIEALQGVLAGVPGSEPAGAGEVLGSGVLLQGGGPAPEVIGGAEAPAGVALGACVGCGEEERGEREGGREPG